MVERALPDAPKVMGPGSPEGGQPALRQSSVRASSVTGPRAAFDETGSSHLVDDPRDPAWGQARSIGQFGHPKLPLGRLGQVHDDGVLRRADPARTLKILVKRRTQREHQPHQAAPDEFFVVVQRKISHLTSLPYLPG
jgi:hypothetical protein